MHAATHMITILGTFDRRWTEESLKEYARKKIQNDIFSTFHASLEEFNARYPDVKVSVYISCLPSEVSRRIISKWFKDHPLEPGLSVTWFGIDEENSLFDKNKMSEFAVMLA